MKLFGNERAPIAVVLLAAGAMAGCGDGSAVPAQRPNAPVAAISRAAKESHTGAGKGANGSASTMGKAPGSSNGEGKRKGVAATDGSVSTLSAASTSNSTSTTAASNGSKRLTAAARPAGPSNGGEANERGGPAGADAGAADEHGGTPQAAPSEGISISPGAFEHLAKRGALGAIEIANTTPNTMKVTLALRPWLQARSGEVSPDRRRSLRAVRLSAHSFALAAGAKRSVALSLAQMPAQRSVYGGIEVTGLPSAQAKQGVQIAYRVVSSMRLNPPKAAQRFSAKAGSLDEQGSVGHGTLLLSVSNTGNTILPIGGKVLISGAGHALHVTAREKVIVPGQTVNLPLSELPSTLARGRNSVTVQLTQGGHGLMTVRDSIDLH